MDDIRPLLLSQQIHTTRGTKSLRHILEGFAHDSLSQSDAYSFNIAMGSFGIRLTGEAPHLTVLFGTSIPRLREFGKRHLTDRSLRKALLQLPQARIREQATRFMSNTSRAIEIPLSSVLGEGVAFLEPEDESQVLQLVLRMRDPHDFLRRAQATLAASI